MSLEDLFELTGMERKRKFDFKLIGYIVCIFVYWLTFIVLAMISLFLDNQLP